MRARWVVLAAVLSLVGIRGEAAPEASIAPTSWEVEFEFHDPQRITLRLPGDAHETTFWYVLYTVTNETGGDVEFYPTFDIVTDRLDVIEGGDDISPSVYDAIKARHKKVYPFFVKPSRMYGLFLQGEDNARTSAVAFRQMAPEVNRFTVFVGGLSGEIVKIRNNAFDAARAESAANAPFFTLRKTLAISYDLPGDAESRRRAMPIRTSQEWVMR